MKFLLLIAVICVSMFPFSPESSATAVADGTLTRFHGAYQPTPGPYQSTFAEV